VGPGQFADVLAPRRPAPRPTACSSTGTAAGRQAFVDNFWLMGVAVLALIPLMFLMKKAVPHKAPAAAHWQWL